ncbi:MAG: FecR family protein [Parvularculaceae bacterium]
MIEQAAELYVRACEPDSTLDDWAAFEQWRGQSPRHEAISRSIEEIWRAADGIPNPPWPTAAEIAAASQSSLDAECRSESAEGGRAGAAAFLAASASFLRQPLTFAAALTIAVSIVFIYLRGGAPTQSEIAGSPIEYSTQTAQHARLRLPDGSFMTLGAKSRVVAEFDGAERNLRLDYGEAYFEVAEDAARPFNVDLGAGIATATGTAFNVWRNGAHSVVGVTEGTVRVSARVAIAAGDSAAPGTVSEADFRTLTAGEEMAVTADAGLGEPRRVDPAQIASWRDGRLIFMSDPLSKVITDINRYYAMRIVIADDAVAEMLFSGTVRQDRISEWLDGVERVFPVTVDVVNLDRIELRLRES